MPFQNPASAAKAAGVERAETLKKAQEGSGKHPEEGPEKKGREGLRVK